MSFWLVGIGGFAGAITRYGIGQLLPITREDQFPLGTLTVNWSGSFLLGFLLIAATSNGKSWRGERLRLLLGTGFLGAYTTFSAFSAETMQMIQSGAWGMAAMYAGATLIGGLVCVSLGYWTGSRIRRAVARESGGKR